MLARGVIILVAGVIAIASLAEAREDDAHTAVGVVGSGVGASRSYDGDLRGLPIAREWKPGDPIRVIARRAGARAHERDHERALTSGDNASGTDPVLDVGSGAAGRAFGVPDVNKDSGFGFTGVYPPDPVGDVGPNHYVLAVNDIEGSRVLIYDKAGNVLAGPFVLDSLAGGSGACADGMGSPIVLYDGLANPGRWLLSEVAATGNHLCVYVSNTADPIAGGWTLYDFETREFPDYPQYAVWPDAYYVGVNEAGLRPVYALNRASMLNGEPDAAYQRLSVPENLGGFGFQLLTPADHDGAIEPPTGAPAYFLRHNDDEAHEATPDSTKDRLQLYKFHVDWTTPGYSTFSGPVDIDVAEFSSDLNGLTAFSCFPQPGTTQKLDPLREPVMWRPVYRKFADHESLLVNWVVDTNGSDHGGIRWVELRRTGTAEWTKYQEGTYSPDAVNRWMGSTAMDANGNIALAYSVSDGASVYPGLRYTGRLAGGTLGTMGAESLIVSGGSSQVTYENWGNYSSLNVDPADDCRFWFTGEYMPAASTTWRTRVASFKFDGCGGSASLSVDSVTVNEGAGVATFTVNLNGTAQGVPEVSYATTDGTATGADYTASTGVLTFPQGTTARTISVPLVNDTLDESDETFNVVLSSPSGAVIASAFGTATIIDDDVAPSLVVGDVAVFEGNVGTTTANVPVSLSAPSGRTVSVSYATANGTAASGAIAASNTGGIAIRDYGAANPYPSTLVVSGASGAVEKVTVTLAGLSHTYPDDVDVMLVGPGGQNVVLLSDAGGGADISGVGLVFDDGASAFVGDGGPLSGGTYKPTNYGNGDIFPAPAPTPSGNELAVFKGTNPNGTWKLFVSDDARREIGSISSWSMTLTTTGGDYRSEAGTLTFPPGTTAANVEVEVNGDYDVEADETFVVNLSGAVNAGIADNQGVGTIRNDDSGDVGSDLNGDGVADLLWRSSSGENAGWLMNGASVVVSGLIAAVASPWDFGGGGDLDGDRRADIVWRNSATGENGAWLMDGTTVLQGGVLGTVDPVWTLAGVGDFNGDRKEDILWTNPSTGAAAIWFMNGLSVSSSSGLPAVGAGWVAAAVGDVNGDYKTDILWFYPPTGDAAVWLMDGSTVLTGGVLGSASGWSAVGLADLNGDARADVTWRNTAGDVAVWFLDGTTVVSGGVLFNVAPVWEIAGIGDFNRDGKGDYFWRNTVNGDNSLWFMDGTQVMSTAIPPALPDVAWTLKMP